MASRGGGQVPTVEPSLDPTTVPVYPVVRVEAREAAGGAYEGVVDDAVVCTDLEFEVVRHAVVAAAARVAARREGAVRAVRVRAMWSGAVFHLVVTADGEVLEALSSLEAARATAPARSGGRRRWVAAAVVAGVAVVAVAAAAVAVVQSGSTPQRGVAATPAPGAAGSDQAVPGAAQLPVVPPAPYAAAARWAVPLGPVGITTAAAAGAGAAAVTADADRVYAAVDGDHVAGFDAATGRQVWSRDVKQAVQVGPALTRVAGVARVVVATSERLYLLSPATGDTVASWPMPAGGSSSVRVTATGPVVAVDSQHVLVVDDRGSLVSRVLPAAGQPVGISAVSPGSLVVVGGTGQVWTVSSSQLAGDPSALSAPDGGSFAGPVGWTGSRLVVAFSRAGSFGSSQVQLRAYAAADGGVGGGWVAQWTTGWVPAALGGVGSAAALVTAPDGGWGIYGTTAVDLATGATSALPDDWQTTAVGDQLGFGTGAGRALVTTTAGVTAASLAAAVPVTVPGQTAPPLLAPQAVAGSAPFLVASDGSQTVLYALTSSAPSGAAGSSGSGGPR